MAVAQDFKTSPDAERSPSLNVLSMISLHATEAINLAGSPILTAMNPAEKVNRNIMVIFGYP